jgi:hypothetical protein
MSLKDIDQLSAEIDAAVHANGPLGKTTATGLNAMLKSLAHELITHEQQTTLTSIQKADLDADGRVPSSQLPSYVDDILESPSYAMLPAAGEAGKVYVTLDTNEQYRWSGSAYALLSDSGLTSDIKAALEASHGPSATNAFITQAEVNTAIAAMSNAVNDSNLVHKTGDESIEGSKTFTMPVTINSPNANGLLVSAANSDSATPVAQFLAPNNNGNIFFALGKQIQGSALFGYSSFGSGPHAFFTTYGRPDTDFTISADNGYAGLGTNSPSERLDVQGNVKAVGFIGDGSQLVNLPVQTQKLYGTTGQSTDGTMTQKAATDALATKQDILTEQVTLSLGSATSTNLPASYLDKAVILVSGSNNKTVYLPVPGLADVGKVIQINYNSYNIDDLISLNWMAPGNPNASFPGANAPADKQLLQLRAFCAATLQVLRLTRPFPYNDVIAGWVITSVDYSVTASRNGASPIFTATADGAQSVPLSFRGPLGIRIPFIISVTCQEAATNSAKTVWDGYYKMSNQNLSISADAGIAAGDKLLVKYIY